METFETSGTVIAYQIQGAGEDLLLLHGFPDSSALWSKQVAELSKKFRVIVPDLPGFGQSSKPSDVGAYRLKNIANIIFALLDHLGSKRVRVAGHDWGALLTWFLLSIQPGRFLKAAVLSCGHPMSFYPAGGLKQRQMSWYILLFLNPQAEEVLQADNWALWRSMMVDADPELIEQQISSMSADGALTAGLNWYRANFSMKQYAVTGVPQLPKMSLPVLGLHSDGDSFLTEEQMTASEQFFEKGYFTYKKIKGAGHWMQKDAPWAVNEALLDFFGQ